MKQFRVVANEHAKADLKKYAEYIRLELKNPQAAKSLIEDFRETKQTLERIADSLQEPFGEELRKRKLKRLNFKKHNYFMLYKVDDDRAIITNVFHASENYEEKLK